MDLLALVVGFRSNQTVAVTNRPAEGTTICSSTRMGSLWKLKLWYQRSNSSRSWAWQLAKQTRIQQMVIARSLKWAPWLLNATIIRFANGSPPLTCRYWQLPRLKTTRWTRLRIRYRHIGHLALSNTLKVKYTSLSSLYCGRQPYPKK